MVIRPLQLAVVLLTAILIGLPCASISCALGQENPVRSKAIQPQWSNLDFEEGGLGSNNHDTRSCEHHGIQHGWPLEIRTDCTTPEGKNSISDGRKGH